MQFWRNNSTTVTVELILNDFANLNFDVLVRCPTTIPTFATFLSKVENQSMTLEWCDNITFEETFTIKQISITESLVH